MTNSSKTKNVLFIMCDQLRADHLSCFGHPRLETPNIDRLAKRGVAFTRAYCSAPTCGPSRMTFYTGRSMFSHGAMWNFVPLSIRELTIGDLLRPAGMEVALVGKTHFGVDRESLQRLGLPDNGKVAALLREGGFTAIDHYEGHANPGPDHPYSRWLRAQGYDGPGDPWDEYVMSALDDKGKLVSGWAMRNAHLPARVREEHSETAYTTNHAIDFIRSKGDTPWFLHLSYIKPHWPYLAPAPYHDMYGLEDCLPIIKSAAEREQAHPVYAAYLKHGESLAFARDEVAHNVRPVYMGLVKQLDDHIGRLFAELERLGRFEDTMVVFTSDHGDYLGDHWLGDKDLFHEQSARIPLIVYDPDSRSDGTRGRIDDSLVEAADFLPTVLDALGQPPRNHLMEGRSLMPILQGEAPDWREVAVSEIDYSFREARLELGQDKSRCRGYMLRSARWKYIYWEGFPAQLFDLENDPLELRDRGRDAGHKGICREMELALFDWMRARKLAVTLPEESIVVSRKEIEPKYGIRIGEW